MCRATAAFAHEVRSCWKSKTPIWQCLEVLTRQLRTSCATALPSLCHIEVLTRQLRTSCTIALPSLYHIEVYNSSTSNLVYNCSAKPAAGPAIGLPPKTCVFDLLAPTEYCTYFKNHSLRNYLIQVRVISHTNTKESDADQAMVFGNV